MTAALAAASARYGVSVAERLATDGRGGALRRAFSLDFPAGGSVLFIHWRGGSRAARRAGDFFFMDGMTAALAAASARYGVSVAERLATDGRGGALRRAFSLDFPAGGSVLFIHWRGGSRAARRAGDLAIAGKQGEWLNQPPLPELV